MCHQSPQTQSKTRRISLKPLCPVSSYSGQSPGPTLFPLHTSSFPFFPFHSDGPSAWNSVLGSDEIVGNVMCQQTKFKKEAPIPNSVWNLLAFHLSGSQDSFKMLAQDPKYAFILIGWAALVVKNPFVCFLLWPSLHLQGTVSLAVAPQLGESWWRASVRQDRFGGAALRLGWPEGY